MESKVDFSAGTEILGFKVVKNTRIEALNADALEISHPKSGARILHISCPDRENCFCVAFPTPPPNDTGMPHILEHMTLAGSEKFQCKEPFFEMIKRSVATFINALTGNDVTYYPISSTVKADLLNLADVYFDAVFHPLLSQATFDREAYHLAPVDPSEPRGKLRYDGIVYSEMKGAFSSPEGILERDAVRKLLPETCHGKESGGNPESIPDLTLEQLRSFHTTNYHPSNACIVTYGDIPTEEWLEFLAPRLDGYDAIERLPPPVRQTPWTKPEFFEDVYPVSAEEDTKDKTYLMLNWLIGDANDIAFNAKVSILSYLLLGNDASPLKKAITDSHVGANVIMEGKAANGLEMTFHLAVDGAEPSSIDAFRKVVFDTLTDLSEKPFDKDDIDAAFQQTVYACNEISTLHALTVSTIAVSAWMAGLDPTSLLDRAPHYAAAKREIDADPMLLSRMIKELFIDNNHRLDIILKPSATAEDEANRELENKLEKIHASLSDEDLDRIAQNAAELEAANARPNTPEQLACLPSLKLSDISPAPYAIPTWKATTDYGNLFIASDKIQTNDIIYLSLSFDIKDLPDELWGYVPRFTEAVSDFGTKRLDYAETARQRAMVCDTISAKAILSKSTQPDASFLPSITFILKTTTTTLDRALDLFREAIFELDPEDKARMADIIIQDRAVLRSDFVQDARSTTTIHSARFLNIAAYRKNQTSGLCELDLLERLATTDAEEAYAESVSKINKIREFLLCRERVTICLVGPDSVRTQILNRVNKWLGEMNGKRGAIPESGFIPNLSPRNEGLYAALQVSFSALTCPAPHISNQDSVAFQVGASIISQSYMLPEIRFKGNAYGAGLTYTPDAALQYYTTYRDPRVSESFETIMRAPEFIRSAKWSQQEINNAILTIVKLYETPIRPAIASARILADALMGTTQEDRARRYAKLLSLKAEEVQDVTLRITDEGLKHASYCVAASEQALKTAAASIPNLTITPIIK